MKRQFRNLARLATAAIGLILIMSQTANAADNTGTGDVAGDPAALVNSNVFQLFSTGASLTLVKTAFLTADGTPLTSGATLPQGTLVDFMIYVNNEGSVTTSDVSVQDVLDTLFVYQPGTIRVDNSIANCAVTVCDSTEEAAIYAAAAAATAGTDAVGAPTPDSVSFDGTDTIDVGNESVANVQLDAAGNAVLAVVFTVQVQ